MVVQSAVEVDSGANATINRPSERHATVHGAVPGGEVTGSTRQGVIASVPLEGDQSTPDPDTTATPGTPQATEVTVPGPDTGRGGLHAGPFAE
jgi:hypothetical protein